jgi:hypothetical protein
MENNDVKGAARPVRGCHRAGVRLIGPAPIRMIPFSGRSVVASSAQEAALQSGPPQLVGTVRRLVLPSAEQSVRWGASLLHHRRHVTANLFPDLDDGLFRQTPGTMIQNSLAARTAERPKPAARLGFREHPGPVRERIPAVLPRGTSNAASLGSLSGAIGVPTRRGATPRASSCR